MTNESTMTPTGNRQSMLSQWVQVTQEMITGFGTVTLDPGALHHDPVWAQVHSPFGKTIAHGFLTASLLTHLFCDARESTPGNSFARPDHVYLNYGFDKMRLVSPVLCDAWVRGRFSLLDDSQRTRAGHEIQKLVCCVEIRGSEAPALTAEWLTVIMPNATAGVPKT